MIFIDTSYFLNDTPPHRTAAAQPEPEMGKMSATSDLFQQYSELTERFWQGEISEATFLEEASALGVRRELLNEVLRNVRQMDGIDQ